MENNNAEQVELTEEELLAQLDEQHRIRIEKLNDLKANGKNPYEITKFDFTHKAQQIRDNFDELEEKDVMIAGRITSWRDMGKANFIDIRDDSGRMQVYVRIDDIGEDNFKEFKKWDLGDIVGVSGFVFKTRRGEISVHAKSIKLLSKSLLPLPEKWHGLKDKEERYRKRYLDLIANPEIKDTFANYHTGVIEHPANLWKFPVGETNPDESRRMFPLVDDIKKAFPGVECRMTNDANAATIGEMIYGNAKGMKDFIMITLGTGLGSGFVANGEMIYGHDGFAGEFGHVIAVRGGRQCGCGRRGCLETYVSATGIKRTVFELMATMTEPSELRDIPFANFDAAMVSTAASHGDPIALEAFRITGELLGYALADAVTITSPEAIFLFGGLAKSGKYIFEPTQWYMEENMMSVFKNKVKLLPSGIQSQNAAILGASALIWQEVKQLGA